MIMNFVRIGMLKALMTGVLLLSGCGAKTSAADTAEVWQAPKDTARYYFAVGEGSSIESAKNRALSEIASRISVTISSSMESDELYTRKDEEEHIQEQLKTKVQAQAKTIEFTHASVEKSERAGDRWNVLVKVDRKELFDNYLRKFSEQDKSLQHEYDTFKQSEIFSRLKMTDAVRKAMVEPKSTLVLLETINPVFDASAYVKQYDEIGMQLGKQQKDAVFNIEADENSKTLETLIRDRLSDSNIKMGEVSAANVRLELKTKATKKAFKTTNPKYKNATLAIRTTTIQVKDRSGRTISNNVIKTKAMSNEGFKGAIDQTGPYEKLIEKKGILSFLGGG